MGSACNYCRKKNQLIQFSCSHHICKRCVYLNVRGDKLSCNECHQIVFYNQPNRTYFSMRIAVVGYVSSGKTALCKAFFALEDQTTAATFQYKTFIDQFKLGNQTIHLTVYDAQGLTNSYEKKLQIIPKCDVFILSVDLSQDNLNLTRRYLHYLQQKFKETKIIGVGLKKDIRDMNQEEKSKQNLKKIMTTEEVSNFFKSQEIQYHEVSAREYDNVREVLTNIIKQNKR